MNTFAGQSELIVLSLTETYKFGVRRNGSQSGEFRPDTPPKCLNFSDSGDLSGKITPPHPSHCVQKDGFSISSKDSDNWESL